MTSIIQSEACFQSEVRCFSSSAFLLFYQTTQLRFDGNNQRFLLTLRRDFRSRKTIIPMKQTIDSRFSIYAGPSRHSR